MSGPTREQGYAASPPAHQVPAVPTPEQWDAAWKSIGLPYRAKLSLHEIKTLFELFHAAMISTSPPAREPLTEKELRAVLQEVAEGIDASSIVMTHWPLVARAIERKVRG